MNRVAAIGLVAVAVLVGASIAALGQQGNPGMSQTASKPSSMAFMQSMETMMSQMHMPMTGDADKDFAMMMAPHDQGVIDMAKVELEHGKDPELRELARRIIEAREGELRFLYDWLIRAQAEDHH